METVLERGIEERCVLIESDRPPHDNQIVRGAIINLVCLCVIFMFTFTAVSGLQNLENSINPDIGIYSLAIITGGGFISCVFAPTIIAFTTAKGALALSTVGLAVFVASNYYPRDYFLLPGAAVYGLFSGVHWTSQGSYIVTISMRYAEATGQSYETILSRFVGIFCMAFQSTQIWGNVISSAVLQSGNVSKTNDSVKTCGAKFCPMTPEADNATKLPPINEVADRTLNTLVTVYLICTHIALLVTIFVLRKFSSKLSEKHLPLSQLLLATVELPFRELNMVLIVPLAFYSGMEQVVIYAEFTRAFVACEIGVEWIGYSMISFGVANTVFSPAAGLMVKYIGRPSLFIIAAAIDVGLMVLMRFWEPNESAFVVFFIVPGLWGLADAIWQTQNSALVGYTFSENQEPAFANLRLWEALGFMIPYLYSNSLCMSPKLYLVGGTLIVTMASVLIVEYRIRRNGISYKKIIVKEVS